MRRILLTGLLLALVACSSNDEVDLKPAKLIKFEERASVERIWSRDIGQGAGKYYNLLPLAVDGDVLYAVDRQGLATAVDRISGRKIWEVKLRTGVGSGVGSQGDRLFVGTLDGEVICLAADSGSELWRSRVSSEVLAPPQSNGNIVVAQTQNGRLYGFSVEDGSQVWMQEVPVPSLTLRGTATPIVTDTAVYAGFASGKMIALDVNDGVVQWEQRVAQSAGRTELERVVDINAAPVLVGDILYAVSFQGKLVAINRGTGRGLWAQPASSYNTLAAGSNQIYVSDADSIVRAFNATSGEPVWQNDQLIRRRISAPQTFGEYLVVADYEGYLHVFRQSDGEMVARRKVDGAGVRSPILSVGDQLFVYGNSGNLEAYSIR